jgi:hypothetical protein
MTIGKRGRPSKADRKKYNKQQEEMSSVDLNEDDNEIVTDDDQDDEMPVDIDIEQTSIKDPFLSDPVIERDYTKMHAEIDGEMPYEIPEPVFDKTRVSFNDDATEDLHDPFLGQQGASRERAPEAEAPERGDVKNPAWDEMDAKAKKAGAAYLADTCINAYVMLNNLGKKWCTFSQEKLQGMALDGKIDLEVLSVEIPISESDTVTIGDFLDQINSQSEEVFTVSEEFKTAAKPLLIEIFKKKGWGMTIEQRLLALIIEDAAPKVAIAFSIQSQFKTLIKSSMNILKEVKNSRAERDGYNHYSPTSQGRPENDPNAPGETLVPENVETSPEAEFMTANETETEAQD